MMEILSRKDRSMALLKAFSDGADASSSLTLVLYPSELVRLKKEFPKLNFAITDSYQTSNSKKHKVEVTRI